MTVLPLVAAVTALGLAFGLNLYAAIAALGLAGRFGWMPPLPPELRGLQHPIVIGLALAFLLVETVAERVPLVDSIWAGIHLLVKPLAAALLVVPLTTPTPPGLRFLVVVAAAFLAVFAHAGRGVVRTSVVGRATRREAVLHAVQALVAALLVVGFRTLPGAAVALAAIVLAGLVRFGPRSWRLLVLTLAAQTARLRALLDPPRPDDPDRLPRSLRHLLPPRAVAAAPFRVVRAGVLGVPGVGDYRNGWLAFAEDEAWFLYRSSLLRPRCVRLPSLAGATASAGAWLDALDVDDGAARCTVLLLKGAPHPATSFGAVSPTSSTASP